MRPALLTVFFDAHGLCFHKKTSYAYSDEIHRTFHTISSSSLTLSAHRRHDSFQFNSVVPTAPMTLTAYERTYVKIPLRRSCTNTLRALSTVILHEPCHDVCAERAATILGSARICASITSYARCVQKFRFFFIPFNGTC